MKEIKTYSLLLVVLLVLILFAWTQIWVPEKRDGLVKDQLLPDNFVDQLQALTMVNSDKEFKIVNQDDVWVVVSPNPYVGNQEYILKGLQIMGEVVSNHNFELQEDNYELNPGRAFFRLEFKNGLEKRLVVGAKAGPAGTIYVLDKDSQRVFVVHNIWSQFLLYPPERLYTPNLPIPGKMVKSLYFTERGKMIWKVEPVEGQKLKLTYKDQAVEVPKAEGLWFFQKVREFQLESLEFGEPKDFQTFGELHIATDKGNIMFEFNPSSEKIRVRTFNVFANVKPYSLKSLGNEIKKVIKSVKK